MAPSVLGWQNAFPGIPAPQHLAGKSGVQDFTYPGAVQPLLKKPTLPEVSQFLSRAPGLTRPQALVYETFITKLVNCGAWSVLDAYWQLGAPNKAVSLVNLIQPKFTLAVVGTMTFTTNVGWAGDGSTGYLDSSFNPATVSGTNYSLNAMCMGLGLNGPLYSSGSISVSPAPGIGTQAGGNNFGLMGAADNSGNEVFAYIAGNAGTYEQWATNANDTTNIQGPSLTGLQAGLLAINRFGLTSESSYWDGRLIYAQAGISSSGLPNANIYIGAGNAQTGGANGFTTSSMYAAFLGGSLTDEQQAIIAEAEDEFMATIGTSMWPVSLTGSASGGVGGAQWSNQNSESSTFTLPAFGINAHPFYNGGSTTPTVAQQIAMLQYLGVTSVRINAVDWQGFVEPVVTTPPTYVFPYDALIAAFRSAGFTVTLNLSYGNAGYNFSPYDLDNYFTAPTTTDAINAWSSYAAAVANHYGATGFIYEIWNEPNIGQFNGQYAWSPAATASPWPNAATSIAAYVALWNAATAAIIGGITFNGLTTPGTPTAVIMSAGISVGGYFVDPETWTSTFLADATLTDLAEIGFHPYGGGIGNGQQPDWSTFLIMSSFNGVNGGKNVALTEMGYTTASCNDSEMLKAVSTMRALLALIQNGNNCIRIEPYELVQESDDYGFFDDSFNPLPSALAYRNLIAAFAGSISTNIYWLNPYVGFVAVGQNSLNQFSFIIIEKSATSFVVIAWCQIGAWDFTYETGGGLVSYSVTDLFGNSVDVTKDPTGQNLTFQVTDQGGPVMLSYTT